MWTRTPSALSFKFSSHPIPYQNLSFHASSSPGDEPFCRKPEHFSYLPTYAEMLSLDMVVNHTTKAY